MSRTIRCENEDGLSVTFGPVFAPFLLLDCDGIYGFNNNVATSENTMIDGATYQGSVTKMRNIVLTLADKDNHQKNRSLLYNLFKPKSKGKFTYIEDGDAKSIDYYVEKVDSDSIKRCRTSTVSLICPDPFFVGPSDVSVTMAGWEAYWEFPHEFMDGGEEFGARVNEKLKTINNDSAADNIGLTITIVAAGAVTNPSVYQVETEEYIKIGTEDKPLNMVAGDKVVITTGTNNKHVYFVHNGVKEEINEYLDEGSEFIQLMHGPNTFGYDAENGDGYMTVVVSFRYRYLGV